MSADRRLRPTIVQPGGGTALDFGAEGVASVMLGGEQTGGTLAVIRTPVAPGAGPAPHVHALEDELYLVAEGRISYLADGRWTEVGPGGVVYLPRGTPRRLPQRRRGARPALAPRDARGLRALLRPVGRRTRGGWSSGRGAHRRPHAGPRHDPGRRGAELSSGGWHGRRCTRPHSNPLRAVAGSETRASLLALRPAARAGARCGRPPSAPGSAARRVAAGWPRRRGLAAGAAQVDGDAPLRPQVARVCEPHAGRAEPRHQPGRRIVGRRSARPPHGLRSPPAPHRQGHVVARGEPRPGRLHPDGDVRHVQRDARLIFAVGKELAEQAPERGRVGVRLPQQRAAAAPAAPRAPAGARPLASPASHVPGAGRPRGGIATLRRGYRLPLIAAAPAGPPAALRASRRHHPPTLAPGSTTHGACLDNPLWPSAQGRKWPIPACLGVARCGSPEGQ